MVSLKENNMLKNTVRWYDEDGYDHITEIKAEGFGELSAKLAEFKDFLDSVGGGVRVAIPQSVAQPAQQGTPMQQRESTGTDAWYDVEASTTGVFKLEKAGDNPAFKVFGKANEGDWTKYGVRCWREPIEELGIDITKLEVDTEYALPENVTGMVVLYDPKGGRKEGYGAPKKVKSFITQVPVDEVPF